MDTTVTTGLSKSRLEMLCDGIFAIVMTLLVLEIGVPSHTEISGDEQLARRLLDMWPEVLSYAVSFALLASFWFAHHFEFGFFARTDRRHIWINILLMLAVTFVPVSTALLGEFYRYRLAVVVYAGNMALAGLLLFWNWWYATRGGRLTVEGFPERVRTAVSVRLLLYAMLFVLAMGLSWISTTAGLAVCVAVPVVYIVMQVVPHGIDAPRRRAGETSVAD
jgi:uncharacterized membrane protein